MIGIIYLMKLDDACLQTSRPNLQIVGINETKNILNEIIFY